MQNSKLKNQVQQLIASPSVSSITATWDQSNEQVIDLLANWFSSRGFHVEKLPVPNSTGKYNLIANYGKGEDGLVLSGHTDTVPFDEHGWASDPFSLTEKNDRWYGLGTADMKSFFALVLVALDDIDLEQLKHPLTIIATADEESTMCGAKALLDLNRDLGRHVIIGEPTSLKPIRMHKGVAMDSIKLTGQSGHSSNPGLGNNALEGMHTAIQVLMDWRAQLQQRYQNPMFEVAVPTVNLGHIHGGDNPNRICGECELHFDIRPLPGMDLDALRAELDSALAKRLVDSQLKLEHRILFDGVPAMETSANADIIKTVEKLTGYQADAVAFGTEGPYFNRMGMDTVILGPGSIDQAHQPNEFMALEQIDPFVNLLKRLIHKYCLQD